MRYIEFEHLKRLEDKNNPLIPLFELEDGSRFYLEPAFYTQLKGFEERQRERYPEIIESMLNRVRRNKRVIFTSDFEYPQTVAGDEYIILEIWDITDPLNIYVEDKSRGSDYGD